MDYFKLHHLTQEPFSNSPDPDFFFESTVHLACLQQLEIAIRLRRGLNVVMGDVGTGKTTLCRQLIRRLSESPEDRSEIETHLLLDPSFSTPREFLAAVAAGFGMDAEVQNGQSEWQIKETIKNFLFRKGVDENKTVVLIIDEGQKLPEFGREILREFLNYDTNEKKLLQIVIFAQNEFRQILAEHQNFADRINQCYLLGPLDFRETREMIRFRLARAGRREGEPRLFTLPALWAIYRLTGGYPRRIITLCHHVLLAAIIRNRKRVGWFLAHATTEKLVPRQAGRKRVTATTAALTVTLLGALIVLIYLPAPQNVTRPLAPPVQTRVETVKTPLPAAALPAAKAAAGKSDAGAAVPPPGPAPQAQSIVATQPPAVPAASEAAKKAATAAVKPESGPSPAAKPEPGRTASPPPPAAKPEPKQSIPSELGKLTLGQGDSLPALLREIYGGGGPETLKALARANPQISDVSGIGAGQTVVLPAIQSAAPPLAPSQTWVQLAKKASLADAYRLLKAYPSDMPPIRLIPSWNPREGLVFTIVLKTGFPGPEGAKEAMVHLPTGAKIMEKAEKDTVYFTN